MTAEEILRVRDHRPFPLPRGPWVMRQEWHDLMFAHWVVDTGTLRALVPPQLELDLWKGNAYLAMTPFVIRGLRGRGMPALPGISHFAEINVRTYVRYEGIPGVFFFSLDAASRSAVLGARLFYGLPYLLARMSVRAGEQGIEYESRRVALPRAAEFGATYAPASDVLEWRPPSESLERFLTERYCLYNVERGRVYRAHIHHLPWPLQTARAEIMTNSMASPLGLSLGSPPDLLHFSRFIEVLVWLPERVA